MTVDALDKARIVGVYATEQARGLTPCTGFDLAFEALQGALDDAGLAISDLDGICSNVSGWPYGDPFGRVRAEMFWARQLRRPMHWLSANNGAQAILEAAAAIGCGFASTVAVIVGQTQPPREKNSTVAYTRPTDEFTEWTGSYTTVQYALVARRYMHEYAEEAPAAMALAAATIRNFGHVNPDAVYFGRGPYTTQDVLDSMPIASPLTLLMCSAINDGGGAVILTNRDIASGTRKAPIRVLAGGNQQPYPSYYELPLLHAVMDEGHFVDEAFARGGIRREDIDFLELYDHFAIGVLLELELYGFCGAGEAVDFVNSGATGLDGSLPTCTDGGCLSYSHNVLPSLHRVIETVRQLRREVKDMCTRCGVGAHSFDPAECRAVRDPRIGLAASQGPPTGGGTFVVLGIE